MTTHTYDNYHCSFCNTPFTKKDLTQRHLTLAFNNKNQAYIKDQCFVCPKCNNEINNNTPANDQQTLADTEISNSDINYDIFIADRLTYSENRKNPAILSKRQIEQFTSDTALVEEYCKQTIQCIIDRQPVSDYDWAVFRSQTITTIDAIMHLCRELHKSAEASLKTYQTQETSTVTSPSKLSQPIYICQKCNHPHYKNEIKTRKQEKTLPKNSMYDGSMCIETFAVCAKCGWGIFKKITPTKQETPA